MPCRAMSAARPPEGARTAAEGTSVSVAKRILLMDFCGVVRGGSASASCSRSVTQNTALGLYNLSTLPLVMAAGVVRVCLGTSLTSPLTTFTPRSIAVRATRARSFSPVTPYLPCLIKARASFCASAAATSKMPVRPALSMARRAPSTMLSFSPKTMLMSLLATSKSSIALRPPSSFQWPQPWPTTVRSALPNFRNCASMIPLSTPRRRSWPTGLPFSPDSSAIFSDLLPTSSMTQLPTKAPLMLLEDCTCVTKLARGFSVLSMTSSLTMLGLVYLLVFTKPSESAGLMINSLTPRVTRSSTSEICFCSLPWASVASTSQPNSLPRALAASICAAKYGADKVFIDTPILKAPVWAIAAALAARAAAASAALMANARRWMFIICLLVWVGANDWPAGQGSWRRRLPGLLRNAAQLPEPWAADRNLDVEDFGKHPAPAVDEVKTAVFDLQAALLRLAPGLLQKGQLATVIEPPHQGRLGKRAGTRQRRAWPVLAHAAGVDHQRGGPQTLQHRVVVGGCLRQHVFPANAGGPRPVQALDVMQTARPAVGHPHPRRAVRAATGLHQMPGQRKRRSAGADGKYLGPCPGKVAGRNEVVQRQARSDRVFGVADELAAGFGQATGLGQAPGMRIHHIEQIRAGGVQIDLVRGHQRAQRERVILDEAHHGAVVRRRCMQRKINARDGHIAQTQVRSPVRKHLHDRALPGAHANEVEGRAGCRSQVHTRSRPKDCARGW